MDAQIAQIDRNELVKKIVKYLGGLPNIQVDNIAVDIFAEPTTPEEEHRLEAAIFSLNAIVRERESRENKA